MIKWTFCIMLLSVAGGWSQNSQHTVADSLYSFGNYSKAIKLYKSSKDSAQYFQKIAKSYEALGNYGMALNYYSRYLEAYPNPQSHYAHGKLLVKTKKFPMALEVFNTLIEMEGNNPEYHYQKGVVLEHLKDTLAMKSYQKAFELDSTHQKAIYKLAKGKLVSREFDQSIALVQIGLSSYENNVELISLKAQSLFYKQAYHDAAAWFEKLLELHESTLFVFEKLRDCYLQTYQYQKALFYAEETLQFEVNHAENLWSMALVYEGMGDLTKAEEYLKASIEEKQVPLDEEYNKLGYLLNRQKRYEESIKVLKMAIEENPENQLSHFYLLNTQNAYYGDLDYRITLHETFLKQFPEGVYHQVVKHRLGKLTQEKFMKE